MAADVAGKTIGDLAGPDLGAVGNAARVSKGATSAPQELSSFSVKKGDNGGVLVCETYERKAPAGRRASSFMGGGDYKENPYSPDDGAAAMSHITDLLGQMGVRGAEPSPEPAVPAPGPRPPLAPPRPVAARPTAAIARGPMGGGAAMLRGPGPGY
jgi:hypothetical protein